MVCQGASEGLEVYKKMGIPPPVCNIKPTYTKVGPFFDLKNHICYIF